MARAEPGFTIGIEEEYLLVDQDSCALTEAPPELMAECESALEGQFSPEFLQCQVEIGTRVCGNVSQAREDLKRLRATVSKVAAKYGLSPIAAACHPFAEWSTQHHTNKDRYVSLHKDLAGVARRLLICGMHVHVGVEDRDLRIDLMNQLVYFLPHLLALSTSSPFWRGQDTGLNSYRLTVFDNLPRTGLPPRFDGWRDYEKSVQILCDMGVIEDSSKIWWDLRPSARFPTIETRICDVLPRLEHALSVAAVTQCLTRMLYRLACKNQRWRIYDNFLVSENRWRAQRYGICEGLIDFGARNIHPMADLIDELISILEEDAAALGCLPELEATRAILETGTSADRQRAAYVDALEAGDTPEAALRAVVRQLIDEYHADL